ncbi:hypothetical protein FZC66_13400 [Priestia megaterium]|nr:hypothetical protein FZC66_13400 [Priestia megaterium]
MKVSTTSMHTVPMIHQKSEARPAPPERVEIQIERTPSKLTIDQTKAWEEMNLKSILKRTKDEADKGRQAVLESIQRAVQQGEELMKIENKGNVIADQAKRNTEKQIHPSNIAFIPSPFSVKIDYQPAKLLISTTKMN